MRVAAYVRVSTFRQVKLQTIEQQLEMVRKHTREQGWELLEEDVFRDDGYSGTTLKRPALDALRDKARLRELEIVVVPSPDRLARNHVHQMVLIEEFEKNGCKVEFVERPMSSEPNDQLLLQIRGAVAEYERTLLSEWMRRGRLAKRMGRSEASPQSFGGGSHPTLLDHLAAVRVQKTEIAVFVAEIQPGRHPGSPVCHRPFSPRLAAKWACHISGDQVGLVSALLGSDLTPFDHNCHCSLLVETQTISYFADIAADPTTSGDDLRTLGSTPVHSVGVTVVLLAILVLNVYKPRGMTQYGWRK